MTANEKFIIDLEENKKLVKLFRYPPCRKIKNSSLAPLLLIPLGGLFLFLLSLLA